MKILVVFQHYYPEPFRVTDFCEELVKRGHEVTVLTGLPDYPNEDIDPEYKHGKNRDEYHNGVHIVRVYEHKRGHNAIHLIWNYFSYALAGKRKVRKLDKDFDVVFIHQTSPVMMAWPGIKYAKKYHKKSIMYCYDLWPASLAAGGIRPGSLPYKIFNRVSRNTYNKVDHICVASKSFIDYLSNTHGIDKNKISYLPQYCEDVFNNIEPTDKNKKTTDFVFAGNIGKMQSVETIIRAANLIKDRKDIKIHIVGDGRDFDNVKQLAEESKTDNVVFYGRRPLEEMPKFYSLADAMIVTLAKDDLVSKTLPGKVQSYMAAGKPIIGAIDGETKTIIEEAKCGFICPSEDYEGLAHIISNTKRDELIMLGDNAKKYSDSHFLKDSFFNYVIKLVSDYR